MTVAQFDERERAARNDITEADTPAEKAAAEKNLAIVQDLKRAQAFYASR
jgi:F-type H+-transporting ATPase subunit epsilon